MAKKATASRTASRARKRNSTAVSVPQVSHFPVAITPDALRGPAPTPKRVVIQDFYGPGQPGALHYLPTTANYLVELGETELLHEVVKKVRDKLARTVVNPDGTPLMTPEQWGEIEPDRLLEINQMVSRAIGGAKNRKDKKAKKGGKKPDQDTDTDMVDDTDDDNDMGTDVGAGLDSGNG